MRRAEDAIERKTPTRIELPIHNVHRTVGAMLSNRIVCKHGPGGLPDGTLAGSTLTMDQALRNLVHRLGLDLVDASRRVSTHAADYLGISERGRLAVGAWGDAVLLDADLNLRDVYLEGRSIEHTNAR